MGKIKENWQVIIFTMIITLTGSLLLGMATNRNSKINSAASVEYVDTKDNNLQFQIDKKADKETVEKMGRQLDFIYQVTYEQYTQNQRREK